MPLPAKASAATATVAVFAALAGLAWARRRARTRRRPPALAGAPPPDLLDASALARLEVLEPGLVLVRGALGPDAQLWVARELFALGHDGLRWWTDDGSALNNSRQGRGRLYDALDSYGPGARALRALCVGLAERARARDAAMPAIAPTHCLALLYASERKLGWHRDDGAQDGRSAQPVVSVSLGNGCDFELKHDARDRPRVVRLDSGDALLFGGPCRRVLHTVSGRVCPEEPAALHTMAMTRACVGAKCPPRFFTPPFLPLVCRAHSVDPMPDATIPLR